MDFRKATLEKLDGFITRNEALVNKLLDNYGLNMNDLMKPQNRNVSSSITNEGNESFSATFHSPGYKYSIKYDECELARILRNVSSNKDRVLQESRPVPSSHKELLTNFTTDERLAIYQEAIQSTPKIDPLPEIEINFRKKDKDEKMTSLTDIAAYRRDVRRRNQKYRVAKNPLTYQEEVRNLIQLQTEALVEYLGQSTVDNVGASQCSDIRAGETSSQRQQCKRRRSRSKSPNNRGKLSFTRGSFEAKSKRR
ncbi:U11/U12 small nuclear ribonucleoprotein 48 kDa protein-like [Malaya genurostris]|uniref:U11/U12 small nuclear ribonucleoprotein 48 kDa protein-like n=1 Tax=Malaya genurostris TaxID=325434 RepID=UPI0026F4072F|nr:U11/U12 small nuclear ribonucleoprotein 48 kDa protein-like [Malaya genurostris]